MSVQNQGVLVTEPVPSDPVRQTLPLPRGAGAYTDEGEGPVILALHGAPGSVRDFRWLAPHLSHALRVVRLDLPGFGGSAPRAGEDRLAVQAEFTLEMIEALGLEDLTVIGHSLGGALATQLATLNPSPVSRLGLLASVGPRMHRARRQPLAPVMGWMLERRWLTRVMRPVFKRAFVAAGFPRRTPFKEIQESFRVTLAMDFEAHAQRLRQLKVPTLVAWCEDDRLVEPEIFEALSELCPEGPRLCFREGGHNLQKTRSEPIAEALLRFVAQA